MKKRLGFVSNSSSSSFVCCVTGAEASGWDMGLEDACMYQCVNGHVFCEKFVEERLKDITKEQVLEGYKQNLLNKSWMSEEKVKEYYNQAIKDFEECNWEDNKEEILDEYEWRYELPQEFCPVCNCEVFSEADGYNYLLEKYNLTNDKVLEMMRADRKLTK